MAAPGPPDRVAAMTQRDDHDGGASARAQAPARRGRRWLRRLLWLPVLVVAFTVLQVVAFRFIDPPGSVFMAIRQVAGRWPIWRSAPTT